jgi:pimeloyl-ACP methyl ester carboxylesterase
MGQYANVSGLRTYYETSGAGDPLVLLHCGGVTADSWFAQLPALAEHYQVFAPERRGRGRTPDLEGAGDQRDHGR